MTPNQQPNSEVRERIYTETEVREMFSKAAEMVRPMIERGAEAAKVTSELLNFRLGSPSTNHNRT